MRKDVHVGFRSINEKYLLVQEQHARGCTRPIKVYRLFNDRLVQEYSMCTLTVHVHCHQRKAKTALFLC